jgi:hypothetical protein
MAPQEQPEPLLVSPSPLEEAAPLSEFSRLAMVFSSPSAAFRDIALRPRWWVPLIVVSIFASIFALAFDARVGWEQGMRTILQNSPQGANMTPAQLNQAAGRLAQFAKFQSYAAIVTTGVGFLIIALILKFVFDVLMGADLGVKRLMAIVGYANLPVVLSTLLTLLVLNLKQPEDFSIQNPLAFNVGAYLGSEAPAWLRSLGTSLDLFSFWVMALLAIGTSSASRRISFAKALTGVLACWGFYVILKVGAVGLQGLR